MPNNNLELLKALEPWCSSMYCDTNLRKHYITTEESKTSFDLSERVLPYNNEKQNGVLVEIDANNFTQQDYDSITKLSQILDNERKGLEQELIHFSDDPEFELGNLKITIINLKTTERELIICKK